MTWTRDAAGEYVKWNEPPHKVGSVVNLLLPGEREVDLDTLAKRRDEYLKLERRRLRKRRE